MKTGTRQPALAKRPLVPPLNMPSASIDPAQHSSKCGFPGGSVAKSLPAKQEMQVPALGREDLLEKAMATRSSILAWETPCTEEPGGLQSTGSQRDGHGWSTEPACTHAPGAQASTAESASRNKNETKAEGFSCHNLQNQSLKGFPGVPAVKTSPSNTGGHPWSKSYDLTCLVAKTPKQKAEAVL